MFIFEVISLPLPLQEFVYVPSISPATTVSKNEVMMTRDPDEKCVVDFRTMAEINFKTGSLSCPPYFLYIRISKILCVSASFVHHYQTLQTHPYEQYDICFFASEKVDLSFVVHQLQKIGG